MLGFQNLACLKTSTMATLQNGKYYHIYNRGNNREDLFRISDNYQHFLRLYDKYVCPVAETFAWVLMKNHFHLLVRVKEVEEILPFLNESVSINDLPGFGNLAGLTSKQFSNLFNSYTKGYNKMFNRSGSLFEKPFHRIEVCSERYLRQLIVYIHTNPVHHGFTDDFKDYPWSSYGSIISIKPTKLYRDKVIDWFDDRSNFIQVHKQKIEMDLIRELIIEE
jgi:REP element-mobilizing transposase RayT